MSVANHPMSYHNYPPQHVQWQLQAPLTPPMSSTFESRRTSHPPHSRVALPPIAQFDKQLSAMQPLTPPDEVGPSSSTLPPINDADPFSSKHQHPPPAPESQQHTLVSGGPESNPYPSPSHSPSSPARTSPPSPKRQPPSHLQLVATPSFISFMQKLLETTQVSQSVIVLSLHYIHRLKERNRFTPAQRGSEFRIAVAGLMMANKFLDDNTYTNKTWSEVSGIELEEINRMEREFLLGVDFNLYVDKPTYESWLNLLKGLVIAKERDLVARSRADSHRRRDARKVSTNARSRAAEYHRQSSYHFSTAPHPPSHQQDSSYPGQYATQAEVYATPARLPPLSSAITAPYYPRARSTSPTPAGSYGARSSRRDSASTLDSYMESTSTGVYHHHQPTQQAPQLRVDTSQPKPSCSNKRTAEAAFSPTSASFANLPSKRPSSMILQIPDSSYSTGMSSSHDSAGGPHSYSPLESLSSFASMSLANGGDVSPERQQQSRRHSQHQPLPVVQPPSHHEPIVPSTLVAPYSYSVENQRQRSQPQELYFYTLASSPMDGPTRSRSRRERSQASEDIEMPAEAEDHEMGEGDEEEQEINGQRLRTRKGKLMRWYRGAETQSTNGYYAYDYSRTHSGCRQPSTSGYYVSDKSAAQPEYSPTYGSSSLAPPLGSQNTLPPLAHPVPRPHIGVVQSASTSPSGIYLRDLGYPGSAYPQQQQQHSQQHQPQPPSQPQSGSWYSASYHPSPVQSKSDLYPLYRDPKPVTYASSTTSSSAAAPASHPNPVHSTSAVPALPHYHDNIWAKPPAVVSLAVRRQQELLDEDGRSDVGSDEYVNGGEGSGSRSAGSNACCAPASGVYYGSTTTATTRSSSEAVPPPPGQAQTQVQESAVPTAPFANAGPAGVHVPFTDYSGYGGRGHGGYSYGYPPQPQGYGVGSLRCIINRRSTHTSRRRFKTTNLGMAMIGLEVIVNIDFAMMFKFFLICSR
ncbi:hypothetical protein CC1G_04329 [Coprinopsis cinerea okayama7|uniref:Cyclin-like domain-containing protein n=1 Tax=Coprinopsis cinerea (strain Okayama-7 / 130 / ATCC MYA-4618 / FGSC 9003) TaxID=240176 RepID=A8N0M6_COPC7|nr:hypothetical protein CC1G_04329 [Coprinopsis cinerea okayama7\|eukprot:XP_001828358.2 hypothetical protein CC1G_04329 [Coprinopsis cinerea okayama7\